mmetsp:Transcript_32461/g.112300  ORF Transcript_32461/g.112300 Transcript_32461/m.112300 type:complete len:264 (+) Transcript_32461:419-1210(+)
MSSSSASMAAPKRSASFSKPTWAQTTLNASASRGSASKRFLGSVTARETWSRRSTTPAVASRIKNRCTRSDVGLAPRRETRWRSVARRTTWSNAGPRSAASPRCNASTRAASSRAAAAADSHSARASVATARRSGGAASCQTASNSVSARRCARYASAAARTNSRATPGACAATSSETRSSTKRASTLTRLSERSATADSRKALFAAGSSSCALTTSSRSSLARISINGSKRPRSWSFAVGGAGATAASAMAPLRTARNGAAM